MSGEAYMEKRRRILEVTLQVASLEKEEERERMQKELEDRLHAEKEEKERLEQETTTAQPMKRQIEDEPKVKDEKLELTSAENAANIEEKESVSSAVEQPAFVNKEPLIGKETIEEIQRRPSPEPSTCTTTTSIAMPLIHPATAAAALTVPMPMVPLATGNPQITGAPFADAQVAMHAYHSWILWMHQQQQQQQQTQFAPQPSQLQQQPFSFQQAYNQQMHGGYPVSSASNLSGSYLPKP